MSTIDFTAYLTNNDIYNTYPAACVPDKLRAPTAKKAKSLRIESFDIQYYEPEARMVAYRTTQTRVRHWIKALNVFLFDYLGDHPDNKGKYQIDWAHDPVNWNPTTLKSIAIDVSSKEDKLNPLMYKLTLFLKTGTIQVQGHYYKTFADAHFPVLKAIVDYTDTQPLQGNIDNSEELSTYENICFTDSEQTNMKTLFVHENTDSKANQNKHDEMNMKTLPEHNINTVHDLNQNVPKAKQDVKKR